MSVNRHTTLFAALLALAVILPSAGPTHAQYYFGKNKVQYTSFDWQRMTTEHFDIYFYTEGTAVARVAARVAEDSYRVLAARFGHEISKRTPLIIYSSPAYFMQTNILHGLIPESVGGVTEFLKGRVVVPFNGSYADFLHVLRHELVHAFMISKLDAAVDRHRRAEFPYPPLWFIEGLAEYWSKPWDADAEMYVKDMVLNDRLPVIDDLYMFNGTFFLYKLGESVCHFIDSTYGSDKIPLLFDNWYKGRTFDQIVQATLGDNLKTISEKWHYHLKQTYFPQIGALGLPKMECVPLTKPGFSEKAVPIRWDDGSGERDWVVFKANRMGYSGIYMTDLGDSREKKKTRTLLKGERSAEYESLHLLRSGIDVHSRGLIVFSSRSKENDVLYLYDLKRRRVVRRLEPDGLVDVRSPRFDPDGGRIVFTGAGKDGHSDLYLLDLADGRLQRLTDDIYQDVDPTFTLDGNGVVFASDRCAHGPDGAANLFRLDLNGSSLTQITSGNHRDQTPECASAGVFFSSDRSGIANLYLLDSLGAVHRLTNLVTGAFDPRVTSDQKRLVFTGYQEMGYQLYAVDLAGGDSVTATAAIEDTASWLPPEIDSNYSRTAVEYETDYSFDIAQSAVGYDPVSGSIGGIQVALSDMLGNRAWHLLLTNTARTKDEFLESFNFGVTHINRERRVNWGLGGFHLYDEYYNDYDQYYYERQAGMIGLLSYPTSKFQRFDLTSLARYSDRQSRYGIKDRETFLVSNYLAWVYDNSLWDISGPIEGRRYRLSIGLTSSLEDGSVFNRVGMADVRHYLRLGRYSAVANRLFAYSSTGKEPQRVYLGGSWSFRGYDRRAFYNRNVLFASTELRFPLIDELLIGFPFGGFGFRGIRGALFFDVGSAWDNHFDRFLGSFGCGFRVALGYVVVLRFDFARTTDFDTISKKTDFDFFFGWNF